MEQKICPTCNQTFEKNKNYSKKYWSKQKYCSIKCSGTLYKPGHTPAIKGKVLPRGPENPNWKGARRIGNHGYVVINPGGGQVLEHRHIMEKHVGRKLSRNEHVHHINHDKTDNRIENLEIIDIREHNRIHTSERWSDAGRPFRKGLV